MRAATAAGPVCDEWRRLLRRDIAWLLAFKLAALVVLWVLFFSADDRPPADDAAVAARLAVQAPAPAIEMSPSGRRAP